MPNDVLIAYERALGLVGVDVWEKLSDPVRNRILGAEKSALACERGSAPTFQPTDEQS